MPYITYTDIRGHIGDVTPPTDEAITESIATWQSFLERATRSWFEPRVLEFRLDGTDSDTLHFGVPIISIEWIKLNYEEVPLNPLYYEVYNSSNPGVDNKANPRIKLVRETDFNDIYTAPLTTGDLRFRKGRQNQAVRGTFGHVDENGEAPALIKRALTKLVLEKLATPLYGPAPIDAPNVAPSGTVIEEWTDGHKYKLSDALATKERRPSPFAGFTRDPEVLAIIKMYRAPIAMATPQHASYK